MQVIVKRFEELSSAELYDIIKLRTEVFVVEQNCVYQDLDDKDQSAVHVFLKGEEGIEGYLRVLDRGVKFDSASIGRVIARKRKCGIGSKIVAEGFKAAKAYFGADMIKIAAQSYAKEFYEKQGFRQSSDEFLLDNIKHIEMTVEI